MRQHVVNESQLPWQTRIQLWHERHSEDGEPVLINGTWHYPTGATRWSDPGAHGDDPPADDLQRLKLQLVYRNEVLRRATKEFDTTQGTLRTLTKGGLHVDAGALENLRRLRDRALRAKRERDAVQEQIDNHPRVKVLAQVKADDEKRKRDMLAEINAIEL